MTPAPIGTLFVVGTPIGNLGDLTERARETLGRVDRIAAEDTRRTGRLLAHLGVIAPTVSYFEGNEARRTAELIGYLEAGERIALVTDAGMPGVSDPGERLVTACLERGIDVEVIPGPSAVLAALVVSGLPMQRFVFEGFLPRAGSKRTARLAALAADERTVVIFESPRRAAATLIDLGAAFGAARPVALCRELTKVREEVLRGSLEEVSAIVADRDAEGEGIRGEIVIVIGGVGEPTDDQRAADLAAAVSAAQALVAGGAKPRAAASAAAKEHGVSVNPVYEGMREHSP